MGIQLRLTLRCRKAAILLALLILAACTGSGPLVTPEPVTLVVAGSTSMGPTLAELAAVFQAQNPNIVVTVHVGGTGAGLNELVASRVDIAALSWMAEEAPATESLQLTPLARDPIAVIVHPTNPVSNVTFLQLRALYRGETLDWAALAGNLGTPEIVSREEGSGTRGAFEAITMDHDRVTLNARVMPTSATIVDYVAKEPSAIGYVTLSAVDKRVRVVNIEGVAPSLETAESGAYGLTRVLYLATGARPTPQASAFIAFAISQQAQPILAKHHVLVR